MSALPAKFEPPATATFFVSSGLTISVTGSGHALTCCFLLAVSTPDFRLKFNNQVPKIQAQQLNPNNRPVLITGLCRNLFFQHASALSD